MRISHLAFVPLLATGLASTTIHWACVPQNTNVQ